MITRQLLGNKLKIISKLLNKPLVLGCLRRCYRVEDHTQGMEDAIFGPAYLPAAKLYTCLEFVETALRIKERQ